MTNERYNELMEGDKQLTGEEISLGWHFCPEWDGLLVGPGMDEGLMCRCFEEFG